MFKYFFIFILFCFSSHAFTNNPEKYELKPREICQISQDFMIKVSARDPIDSKNYTEWRFKEIKLTKDDFLYLYKKKSNGTYWYVTSDLSQKFIKKNRDTDKIEGSFLYEDIKIEDVIIDCKKIKTKTELIKYETHDVFLQDDLFDGLNDNKKITGEGLLEFPTQSECSKIKSFPVMFLIYHSGGKIMPAYKNILHEMCIATFEPNIFGARGHEENFYDTSKDIAWTTEHAGALDALKSLDVVSKNKKVDPSKIGIMGWSWGASVAIETQNKFNLNIVKPKNEFAFHFALYPYCYHYENSRASEAPLFILMGDKDYLPYKLCEEYISDLNNNGFQNKEMKVFKGATHMFDMVGSDNVNGTIVSPECRVYTDIKGEVWVRPNDKKKWFNISANGGWFVEPRNPEIYKYIMNICWGFGNSSIRRHDKAYNETLGLFRMYIKNYLFVEKEETGRKTFLD
jgi:dienelactone hydrolase